jgi:hypothetical protein
LKWSNALTANYYFGTKTQDEANLLKLIIKDTDLTFMKWAINVIMNWNCESAYCNLIHIHGTNDRIFPIDNIKNAIMIENGGHFMIVNRAAEISKIIQDQIQ